MSIVEFLSQPFWQRLGLTLVHFLWQGLAVAVLVGVFVRVLRLKHGNGRYGAYLLAFIAMIACPVVTFTVIDIDISPDTEPVTGADSAEVIESFPYTALSEGAILPEVETSGPALPTLAYSIPLHERISGWLNVSMPWILVIWMAGVVVLSLRLLMGFVGVYRWRHHLEPLPERLAQRIASLSEGLGMGGFSRIFISPTVLQAMAVGYLRPIVLLPAAMLTQMQPEMLEAVIAHELAHIRRFDLWVNLVQRVTETLLFYHPAVWWLSNCLRRERELCCDELAVKATGERITYASTLESVGRARFMAKQPVLATGLGKDNKPTLGRVRHILGLKPAQRNCPFWLAGVITVLFLAALVIPTTLALTSRTNEQVDIQEKKDQKELSKFKKKLPNDVTVELLCLYYGKDIKDSKFWKPDGSLMSNLESQEYREKVIFPKWSSKDFKFEYGFMVRFNPLDSISIDVFVKQGQMMDYNYPKSEGIAAALVASDWNDRKEGFSRIGNIKVAVASGPWDTHKSSARISEPSVRYLDDKSMIMFSPPRKTDEWLLDVTVNSDTIDLDCFYELKEGSIHHAQSSGTIGHPNWIGVEQRTPMFVKKYSLLHEPEQIKNYIIKYRKFEIIEFKNVSLKPNFKTDVQIEVEKTASNNSGGDSKRHQLVTFEEGMSIREALRFLGKAYKKNIIPSEKVAGQVPVNELYNVTFEEALQAVLGTHKYIIEGKFIRVYTKEEFESIYPEEKTNLQVEVEKSDLEVEGTGITAEKESEFSAILSNDVTVELVGMCEYPNVDKQWWRPDGSLLVNPPYDESNLDILSSRSPDAIPIEFAFRLSGNLSEPAWEAKVKGDEQAFVWWTGRQVKDGEFLTDIKSIGMFVKSDQRTLDLRLGFSLADRPYEWVDFKNISVKPNFKPDVQVEAGKEALTAEKIVLKLVDNSGRPVAGAKVGTSVRTRDKQILNSKLYWSLSSKEKDVSDEDGKIVLTQDNLFPQSWNPDRRRALYILNEERQIGAFCEISKDDERNHIELTLEPVCHVHGKLSSEDLEEIGRPLTWSNVYLSFNKDSHGVLSCMSEKQQFDFWVPSGEYELNAYGSGEGASTKHVRPIIEVKTGQSELDLGVVDLPATKLSTLIGKSAPEIGPIRAWKNGSPVKLSELRGKPVILHFGGGYPSTSRDLPELVELHEDFHDAGLVIIAIYNCESMEQLEERFRNNSEKYGGASDVPFRLAVDGGQGRPIEGTDRTIPGATYAAYEISVYNTTVLINSKGEIVEKLNIHSAKEKLDNILGVEVKTTVSTWRQRFEEVYRLEDNRIIKRIAPPFIPERRDYYVNERSSQASAISRSPDRFVFHWDGKLKDWGLGFTSKLNLDSILDHVLRLKSFEYYGPEELLNIELPGDWIIRDEVSQEIKLKALEQLIAEEFSRTIQFEKRTVERQVIVVTGSFNFHPPSETYEHTSVHLYADELDPDEGSGGGTADSVNDFLLRLGNLVDMPVVDHTESSKKLKVPYRHHRSSYLRRTKDKAEKATKLQMLLAILTKQTELQFRIAKRPVEVWFITEKQKDK